MPPARVRLRPCASSLAPTEPSTGKPADWSSASEFLTGASRTLLFYVSQLNSTEIAKTPPKFPELTEKYELT